MIDFKSGVVGLVIGVAFTAVGYNLAGRKGKKRRRG